MAIKDKLEAIAKTAGEKAGDMVETTKLNIKINEEKGKISKCMEEAGQLYYQKFLDGEELPSEIMDVFCRVKDSEEIISNLQEQIKMVKGKE